MSSNSENDDHPLTPLGSDHLEADGAYTTTTSDDSEADDHPPTSLDPDHLEADDAPITTISEELDTYDELVKKYGWLVNFHKYGRPEESFATTKMVILSEATMDELYHVIVEFVVNDLKHKELHLFKMGIQGGEGDITQIIKGDTTLAREYVNLNPEQENVKVHLMFYETENEALEDDMTQEEINDLKNSIVQLGREVSEEEETSGNEEASEEDKTSEEEKAPGGEGTSKRTKPQEEREHYKRTKP